MVFTQHESERGGEKKRATRVEVYPKVRPLRPLRDRASQRPNVKYIARSHGLVPHPSLITHPLVASSVLVVSFPNEISAVPLSSVPLPASVSHETSAADDYHGARDYALVDVRNGRLYPCLTVFSYRFERARILLVRGISR